MWVVVYLLLLVVVYASLTTAYQVKVIPVATETFYKNGVKHERVRYKVVPVISDRKTYALHNGQLANPRSNEYLYPNVNFNHKLQQQVANHDYDENLKNSGVNQAHGEYLDYVKKYKLRNSQIQVFPIEHRFINGRTPQIESRYKNDKLEKCLKCAYKHKKPQKSIRAKITSIVHADTSPESTAAKGEKNKPTIINEAATGSEKDTFLKHNDLKHTKAIWRSIVDEGPDPDSSEAKGQIPIQPITEAAATGPDPGTSEYIKSIIEQNEKKGIHTRTNWIDEGPDPDSSEAKGQIPIQPITEEAATGPDPGTPEYIKSIIEQNEKKGIHTRANWIDEGPDPGSSEAKGQIPIQPITEEAATGPDPGTPEYIKSIIEQNEKKGIHTRANWIDEGPDPDSSEAKGQIPIQPITEEAATGPDPGTPEYIKSIIEQNEKKGIHTRANWRSHMYEGHYSNSAEAQENTHLQPDTETTIDPATSPDLIDDYNNSILKYFAKTQSTRDTSSNPDIPADEEKFFPRWNYDTITETATDLYLDMAERLKTGHHLDVIEKETDRPHIDILQHNINSLQIPDPYLNSVNGSKVNVPTSNTEENALKLSTFGSDSQHLAEYDNWSGHFRHQGQFHVPFASETIHPVNGKINLPGHLSHQVESHVPYGSDTSVHPVYGKNNWPRHFGQQPQSHLPYARDISFHSVYGKNNWSGHFGHQSQSHVSYSSDTSLHPVNGKNDWPGHFNHQDQSHVPYASDTSLHPVNGKKYWPGHFGQQAQSHVPFASDTSLHPVNGKKYWPGHIGHQGQYHEPYSGDTSLHPVEDTIHKVPLRNIVPDITEVIRDSNQGNPNPNADKPRSNLIFTTDVTTLNKENQSMNQNIRFEKAHEPKLLEIHATSPLENYLNSELFLDSKTYNPNKINKNNVEHIEYQNLSDYKFLIQKQQQNNTEFHAHSAQSDDMYYSDLSSHFNFPPNLNSEVFNVNDVISESKIPQIEVEIAPINDKDDSVANNPNVVNDDAVLLTGKPVRDSNGASHESQGSKAYEDEVKIISFDDYQSNPNLLNDDAILLDRKPVHNSNISYDESKGPEAPKAEVDTAPSYYFSHEREPVVHSGANSSNLVNVDAVLLERKPIHSLNFASDEIQDSKAPENEVEIASFADNYYDRELVLHSGENNPNMGNEDHLLNRKPVRYLNVASEETQRIKLPKDEVETAPVKSDYYYKPKSYFDLRANNPYAVNGYVVIKNVDNASNVTPDETQQSKSPDDENETAPINDIYYKSEPYLDSGTNKPNAVNENVINGVDIHELNFESDKTQGSKVSKYQNAPSDDYYYQPHLDSEENNINGSVVNRVVDDEPHVTSDETQGSKAPESEVGTDPFYDNLNERAPGFLSGANNPNVVNDNVMDKADVFEPNLASDKAQSLKAYKNEVIADSFDDNYSGHASVFLSEANNPNMVNDNSIDRADVFEPNLASDKAQSLKAYKNEVIADSFDDNYSGHASVFLSEANNPNMVNDNGIDRADVFEPNLASDKAQSLKAYKNEVIADSFDDNYSGHASVFFLSEANNPNMVNDNSIDRADVFEPNLASDEIQETKAYKNEVLTDHFDGNYYDRAPVFLSDANNPNVVNDDDVLSDREGIPELNVGSNEFYESKVPENKVERASDRDYSFENEPYLDLEGNNQTVANENVLLLDDQSVHKPNVTLDVESKLQVQQNDSKSTAKVFQTPDDYYQYKQFVNQDPTPLPKTRNENNHRIKKIFFAIQKIPNLEVRLDKLNIFELPPRSNIMVKNSGVPSIHPGHHKHIYNAKTLSNILKIASKLQDVIDEPNPNKRKLVPSISRIRNFDRILRQTKSPKLKQYNYYQNFILQPNESQNVIANTNLLENYLRVVAILHKSNAPARVINEITFRIINYLNQKPLSKCECSTTNKNDYDEFENIIAQVLKKNIVLGNSHS